jgi:transposase
MRHNTWTEITRPKYQRAGRRYASDLTDAEWRLIEPFMPPVKRLGRPREIDLRAVVDAIDPSSRQGTATLSAASNCPAGATFSQRRLRKA